MATPFSLDLHNYETKLVHQARYNMMYACINIIAASAIILLKTLTYYTVHGAMVPCSLDWLLKTFTLN